MKSNEFFIGISLVLLSSLFIGSSFVLKKKGLLQLSGGFGYLYEIQWWIAYGFAPALLVTPLGALSVLVRALMAVRFLDEKLNILSRIGCLLTVCEFLFFSFIICIGLLCLIFYYVPRLGPQYVHIYILICSLLGAFTITACKGIAIGLEEFYTHK
ncbi:unnamed protein product [Adineta steineri]|uniref:Uncharacterized protein n=1 Tax=Adineta steineri TaxID=433720 RepID=A0A813S5L3_9BILA|nr:unnamed protein product [Adineta steineri]CAF0795310.1 unnamed protein product [Adineta steineri]